MEKRHVAEPGKDTWANAKPPRGRTWKGHVGKPENDTWTNQKMTRGQTGN
jgi:hypothetical protein